MKALLNRVGRLSGQYPKDQKYSQMLRALEEPLEHALNERDALLPACADALQYRWMLEEFRVSLFAQNLGTRQAVSEKRLVEQWGKVQLWLQANPR